MAGLVDGGAKALALLDRAERRDLDITGWGDLFLPLQDSQEPFSG